jgi:D-alanyl-lipoteichoic acid acyltransferase DltB (MBOAT superfamily)
MLGIVLVLHFGSIHLLSCYWRSVGVDAKPLMNWPIATRSLSDFWGRRWNVAFRDLTHPFLFRPLLKRVGPRGSLVVGFLFSGVVHDVVISVPARGGYGWPTLFFAIQGVGIFVERSALGKKLGLGSGWRGWLFSVLMLAGPAAMLFHPPFVNEVVLPFLRVFGAIP